MEAVLMSSTTTDVVVGERLQSNGVVNGVGTPESTFIPVNVEGTEYRISRGTKVRAFIKKHFPNSEHKYLGAIVANRLVDLDSPLAAPCHMRLVTYNSKEGARIYRATLTIMLCEAVYRCFPNARVQVGQSLGDGYFFDVFKTPALSRDDVELIEKEMRAMVERKELLNVRRVPSHEAMHILTGRGDNSKVGLVKALRVPWVPLVTMGTYMDVWLHPLLPGAEAIQGFSLEPYADGLVLGFPPASDVSTPPRSASNHAGLFSVYRETRDWNRLLGVETVSDLNRAIINGSISEVIRVAEALHERKFASVADQIVAKKEARLVLVAGPSSSGKTTTVKRLRMQLMAVGVKPKEISLDNYYVDREKTPRDENGQPDFECLEAIDLELLNEQLQALLAGEEVALPKYSFTKGKREEKREPMRLEQGEILLIEGIHGLNDRLTASIPDDHKLRIYASALTQLCIDDHNRIFTSDARLLRRIVRDRRFRGYSAQDTLKMWSMVRRGEEKYLFPFQDRADIIFNSALVYEQAVLKIYAERFLMEVPPDAEEYVEANRLIDFLDLFIPIVPQDVPATSLLREFIGDSAFRY